MTIALVVLTDGHRPYIHDTIPSALTHLRGDFSYRMIYEDTAEPTVGADLRARYAGSGFEIVSDPAGRRGYDGAIRAVWEHLRWHPGRFHYVFWLEDDFVFERDVDVDAMSVVLSRSQNLAQLVLLRQPVNEQERAAGGIVQVAPGEFTERELVRWRWMEHRRFWSHNPCLFRRTLLATRDWPHGAHSEGRFGMRLLEDPDLRFGFWGAKDDPPAVTHIGDIPAIGDLR
jgi:hypothetical protein